MTIWGAFFSNKKLIARISVVISERVLHTSGQNTSNLHCVILLLRFQCFLLSKRHFLVIVYVSRAKGTIFCLFFWSKKGSCTDPSCYFPWGPAQFRVKDKHLHCLISCL